MSTEELLYELVSEVKLLRKEFSASQLDHVDTRAALGILGLKNQRMLTHFVNEGLLTRRRGGKGFVYYREELSALALKLKTKEVAVPQLR